MISKVTIKNFKSIKDLEFSSKRINVFIGEPNTGKSNILAALGVFSEGIYEDNGKTFQEVIRYKSPGELFYDRDFSEKAWITADTISWTLRFESSQFQGVFFENNQEKAIFSVDQDGRMQISRFFESGVRYYRYNGLTTFNDSRFGLLRAPYGQNLAAVISTNKKLRGFASDLFMQKGFRLWTESEKNEFGMAKDVDEQLRILSYSTVSETFRRIIFFAAMLATNENSILLLDEPEANTFPMYTKYMAERIAFDTGNQFFITTHNPYLLSSILEKTPANDLSVFVTTMDKFETHLHLLPDEKLPELMEYDVDAFFNLDRLMAQ